MNELGNRNGTVIKKMKPCERNKFHVAIIIIVHCCVSTTVSRYCLVPVGFSRHVRIVVGPAVSRDDLRDRIVYENVRLKEVMSDVVIFTV